MPKLIISTVGIITAMLLLGCILALSAGAADMPSFSLERSFEMSCEQVHDIAVDSIGQMYVLCEGGDIQVYGPDGTYMCTWESNNWWFNGIGIDSNDLLYAVGDGVQVFDLKFNLLTEWRDVYGEDIAINDAGGVYVADSDRIHVLGPSGRVLGQWESRDAYHIAINSNGGVYAAGTDLIEAFALDGSKVFHWTSYKHSYDKYTDYMDIFAMAIDADDRVYAAGRMDTNFGEVPLIRAFDFAGRFLGEIYLGNNDEYESWGLPTAMAIDSVGRVYVTLEGGRIQVYRLHPMPSPFEPKIWANWQASAVSIERTEPVVISIANRINEWKYFGQMADWWLISVGPDGQWRYLDAHTMMFMPGIQPFQQARLSDFDELSIVKISDLNVGMHWFFFGIDTINNNVIDTGSLLYDIVLVNVYDGH